MLRHIQSTYPELVDVKFIKVLNAEPLLEKFEKDEIVRRYKFGVLYAKDGQNENEMFSNGLKQ